MAQGRYYTNPYLDGDLSPSVTNILWNSTLAGMDEWSARAAAEYVWRNRKLYTRLDDVVAAALEEPYRRLNYHADIGTRVHHLTEHPEDEGDECREVQRAMNAWDDFLNDKNPTILAHEVMLAGVLPDDEYGPDTVGTGGTLDKRIIVPNIGHVQLELKTSRILHDAHAFQAAAYKYLWEYMGGEPFVETWLLRLGKYDGEYEIETVDLNLGLKGFKGAKMLFEVMGSDALWPDRTEQDGWIT